MENIDRFFDSYDRILPGWFTDAAVTSGVVLLLAWVFF